MLGLIYLAIGSLVGFQLIKILFPTLFTLAIEDQKLQASNEAVPDWMVLFPASFVFGTLSITWITYIFAYLFRFTGRSMFFGNVAAFIIFTPMAFLPYVYESKKLEKRRVKLFKKNEEYWVELLFCMLVLLISALYIFRSFYVKNDNIITGFSVYSDFGPHLAMIRSFSLGDNFPTGYPHFAGNNIRYHFMFLFLVGNLEYLGLRLDWAFNLPSLLSLLAFLMLLFSLAVLMTGKRMAGFLAGLMFFFRSSSAFFTFMAGETSIFSGIRKIVTGMEFIGETSHKDWGLWTFKDYINQRHFAFSMGILILLVIIYYPRVLNMVDRLGLCRKTVSSSGDRQGRTVKKSNVQQEVNWSIWIKEFLYDKDSWLPENWKIALGAGLMLGLIAFWHGSILISTLLVLCIMAVFSKHRLEYAITAAVTIGLSIIQTDFFAGETGSLVGPRIFFGFLAEKRDLPGVLSYYLELLGVLPVVVAAGVLLSPKGVRWLSLAFLSPLVFATTVTLVPDIAINHKYVAVSVILLNIFAAYFLVLVFSSRSLLARLCAVALLFFLTVTGIANSFTLYNMDKNIVSTPMDHPVKEWVVNNTKTSDIFLTPNYVTHPILLAGRKIFNGYQYFSGSAGYDTKTRDLITSRIYGNSDIKEIKKLLSDNGIDYIVIDDDVRNNQQFKVNENLFDRSFKMVYSYLPEKNLKIYKVK